MSDTKYIKTNVEGLVKDPRSRAILSVDNKKLDAYKRQKKFMAQANDTAQRLNDVEGRLDGIEYLLKQVLEKLTTK